MHDHAHIHFIADVKRTSRHLSVASAELGKTGARPSSVDVGVGSFEVGKSWARPLQLAKTGEKRTIIELDDTAASIKGETGSCIWDNNVKHSFKDLLRCLEEEHSRHERAIRSLTQENRLLRAETAAMQHRLSGQDGATAARTSEMDFVTQPQYAANARPGIGLEILQSLESEQLNDSAATPVRAVSAPPIRLPSDCDDEERKYHFDGCQYHSEENKFHNEPLVTYMTSLSSTKERGSTRTTSSVSSKRYVNHQTHLSIDQLVRSPASFKNAVSDDMAHRESIPLLNPVFADNPTGADGDCETKSNRSRRKLQRRSTTHVAFETNTGNMILMAHKGSLLGLLQLLVVRPNAWKKVVWDLLSVLIVSYDVIVIPLAVMDIDSSRFMETMDWITTIYWTLDLPFSFLTGFHRQGAIEMRPRAVACNYFKSWFFFDIVVVSVDWFIIFTSSFSQSVTKDDENAAGVLRFGKTGGRINRMFRAVRLMRFFKMQRLVVEILQLVKSEYVHTLCNAAVSVLLILVVAHYIACGWYYTGKVNLDEGNDNWISNLDKTIGSDSLGYKYLTALHWSLTQFTPASMEVRPYNLSERLYSIVVLFFALVCFSSFLGSITSAVSQLRRLQHHQTHQQILMRKFFSDNKLSVELGQRIWKYIKNTHFNNRTRMPLEDLPFVGILPLGLKRDLSEELYRPYLTRLPFLLHFASIEPEGLGELSLRAVGEGLALAEDELFFDSQPAERIYIGTAGKMKYTDAETLIETTIKPGTWVAEPALWFQWHHFGQLACITSVEFLVLKPDEFANVIREQHSLTFAREYASCFARYLTRLDDGRSWKTDLITDREDLHCLVIQAFRKAGYDDHKLTYISALNYKSIRGGSTQGGQGFAERLRLRFRRGLSFGRSFGPERSHSFDERSSESEYSKHLDSYYQKWRSQNGRISEISKKGRISNISKKSRISEISKKAETNCSNGI